MADEPDLIVDWATLLDGAGPPTADDVGIDERGERLDTVEKAQAAIDRHVARTEAPLSHETAAPPTRRPR